MTANASTLPPCQYRFETTSFGPQVTCTHPQVFSTLGCVPREACRTCSRRSPDFQDDVLTGACHTEDNTVTVIVPTYNCGRYLKVCIESLQRQSVSCGIVVVDDASTDETKRILREYDGPDGITTLRHETNQGANAARNTGIAASRSKWIIMADADAVYQPYFVESLLQHATPDVDLVYGEWDCIDAVTGKKRHM